MKLTSISIVNFKGIGELEAKLGAVTALTGENGSGKTSFLDAIMDLFEGGHHPDRVRRGTKKAEITATFEDEHGGEWTAKKTISARSSQLVVTTADGQNVPSPQGWLKDLASGISFDPIRFIEDPKARAEYIRSVLAQSFTPDEILDVIPRQLQKEAEGIVPTKTVDLDGLERIRETMYKSRTQRNALADQARKTVLTLKQALPEDEVLGGDPIAELKRAQLTLGNIADEKASRVSALTEERDRAIAEIAWKCGEEIATVTAEYEPKILDARIVIDRLSKAVHDRGRIDELKTQLSRVMDEAALFGTDAERLTRAIEGIDGLRERKLRECPIEGAEIREGQLYIDGVPFQELNTAAQYFVAFQFAALRPGKLGLMVCDRAETFDDENWGAFKSAAERSGFQVLAARVVAGKGLTIESDQLSIA